MQKKVDGKEVSQDFYPTNIKDFRDDVLSKSSFLSDLYTESQFIK